MKSVAKDGGIVRIGPAGWSYSDWEGIVYPRRKRTGFDPLVYLSHYFNVIEINSTFYRPPFSKTSLSWEKRTASNPDFRFTVKLFRGFTHEREGINEKAVRQWKEGMEPLVRSGKLGAVLVQFPYSFHYDSENMDYLYWLKRTFPEYPLILEVRHRSWDCPEVFEFLRDIGIGFCNIDQPQVSYSVPPSSRVTLSVAYVRLHGRNVRDWFRKNAGRDERYNYLYTEPELDDWLRRIRQLRKEAREVYVIANNHYQGQAVCNALQLIAKLVQKPVAIPDSMLSSYPQLAALRNSY